MASFDNRVLALANLLDCYPTSVSTHPDTPTKFTHEFDVYLVYTDHEANKAWDKALDDIIYDEILPQIPDQYRAFFDHAAWKREARANGRNLLSTYNELEYRVGIEGITYFVYQVNE